MEANDAFGGEDMLNCGVAAGGGGEVGEGGGEMEEEGMGRISLSWGWGGAIGKGGRCVEN